MIISFKCWINITFVLKKKSLQDNYRTYNHLILEMFWKTTKSWCVYIVSTIYICTKLSQRVTTGVNSYFWWYFNYRICRFFQSQTDSVSANFHFIDEESGLDHFKFQVFQHFQGSKHQIHPGRNITNTIVMGFWCKVWILGLRRIQ